jgi:hypothetical protein
MTKIQKKDIESKTLFDKKPTILPKANYLINDWGKVHNKPKSIIELKGVPILQEGTILSIKSQAKVGKTSHCEAIISSFLANGKTLDDLGYKTTLYGYRQKILFIDTEQSSFESQNSYNRIAKRCCFDLDQEKPNQMDNLIHVNFKTLNCTEKYETLIRFLEDNDDIGIVIIDVVTDFAEDIMDNKDARKFIDVINRINSQVGIVVSIHTNQGNQTNGNVSTKARGHIGSELERKSSSVLELIKGKQGNPNYVNIALNRIGIENNDIVAYEYSNELNLFVQTERINTIDEEAIKNEQILEKLQTLFNGTALIRRVDFINNYSTLYEVTKEGGRKFFDVCKKKDFITESNNKYRINYSVLDGVLS